MGEVIELRQQLRSARYQLGSALRAVPEADLERRWSWQGGVADVRYALLRAADDDQACLVAVRQTLESLGWRQSEAQYILGLAEISRGDLLGRLTGVPDILLDQTPRAGEWPLRLVLGHILVTERRYWQRTVWHVAEARAGRPTTAAPPAGVVDPMEEAGTLAQGTLAELHDRLAAVREEALLALADCTEADLAAPTNWSGFDVDVRFRLLRFAAHEREHTVQVAKTLRWLNHVPTEPQRLLAQAQVARGQTLAYLVGLPDDLLHQRPAPGVATVAESLRELLALDAERIASVQQALSA